jgi:hypothetical protein
VHASLQGQGAAAALHSQQALRHRWQQHQALKHGGARRPGGGHHHHHQHHQHHHDGGGGGGFRQVHHGSGGGFRQVHHGSGGASGWAPRSSEEDSALAMYGSQVFRSSPRPAGQPQHLGRGPGGSRARSPSPEPQLLPDGGLSRSLTSGSLQQHGEPGLQAELRELLAAAHLDGSGGSGPGQQREHREREREQQRDQQQQAAPAKDEVVARLLGLQGTAMESLARANAQLMLLVWLLSGLCALLGVLLAGTWAGVLLPGWRAGG